MFESKLERTKRVMLARHLEGRGIHDARVLTAMLKVPRERFVDEADRKAAYADRAIEIGLGQTISQPYIVALMTQALELVGSEKVLEIGTGSGYQTAILAELARSVISIERHEELSRLAGERLREAGYRNATCIVGDGTLGWPSESPYDRVLIAAGAAEIPSAVFEQLTEGGILVIPVGQRHEQTLQAIRKVDGTPCATNLATCRFVPLIGLQGWPNG